MRLFGALALTCSLIGSASAADAAKMAFDLPADPVDKSLKRFSEQAGREVLFDSRITRGIRANSVRGEMSPAAALDSLLANTGLVAVHDGKTGAISVRKELPEEAKNGPRAARTAASDRPSQDRINPAAIPVTNSDNVQVLSPFEVVADTRGYYASNTMSGTRLNSNLEDLASSISIVTKEMMSDFALLDINDVFNYEVSTEGIGNYTDLTITPGGEFADNSMLSPTTANRVRGISGANISLSNYETSRRVPIDPSMIDSLEISCGPNSSIFGLGQAGGTVNLVAASAALHRNKAQVQLRADDWGGYRSSFDVNRVLIPGKLAVRGSAVLQHEEWVRKPSGVDTRLLNGMIKAQPFKKTTLTGFYSYYKMSGARANYTPPFDGVTFWRESGRPTWDPLTESYRLNGQLTHFPGGPRGRLLPPFFTDFNFIKAATGQGTALMGIDGNGAITHWTPSLPTSTNTPETQDLVNFHYVETGTADIRVIQNTQPLFASAPMVKDKALYDWSSINLAAINRSWNTTHTYKVELEQLFFDTSRNMLAAQIGWFREDSRLFERQLFGKADGFGHRRHATR